MFFFDAPITTVHAASAADHPLLCPRRALLALPAQEACVRTARHWAADLLGRWGVSEDERDCAVLIVDELTANAARYGHADMTLLLAFDREALHITVIDSGPAVRRPPSDLDPDEHGRGSAIVRLLAQWTDSHQTPHGREVHAALCWAR